MDNLVKPETTAGHSETQLRDTEQLAKLLTGVPNEQESTLATIGNAFLCGVQVGMMSTTEKK